MVDDDFSLKSFDLTGKVVVITGGASGLGECYTQAVTQVGADVMMEETTSETPTKAIST